MGKQRVGASRILFVVLVLTSSILTGFPTIGSLSPGVQPASASGWLAGWTYRKTITVDHTKVGAALTNFPTLVALTSTNFTFANALASGNDIRFTTSDSSTQLDYERARYNNATQVAEFWVRLPTVSNTVDTTFYMYYGNSGAADGANKTGVWDTNAKGVWHLDENPAVACFTGKQVCDSTTTAQHGTLAGAMDASDQVVGKIGTGLDMDGSDDRIDLGNTTSLNGQSQFTMNLWVKPKSLSDWPIGMAKYQDGNNTYGVQENGSGGAGSDDVSVNVSNGSSATGSTTTNILAANTWGMWTVVFDGSQSGNANRLKFYFNGTLQTMSFSGTVPATSPTNASSLVAGSGPFIMDNMSIANTARSAAWVQAMYYSENNNLVTYSAQTANVAPGTPTLAATPAFDNMATPSTTPTLGSFASTDADGDALQYEIQWSTDSTFSAGVVTQNSVSGGNGFSAPSYASGVSVTYTLTAGEALTNGATYWWRVRSRDPGGLNAYSSYTTARSLTVNTSLTYPQWFQTTDAQLTTGTLINVVSNGSGSLRLTHASGSVKSKSMDFDWVTGVESWDKVSVASTETTGDIKVSVFYTASTLCDTIVPDGVLSGNAAGFDVSQSPRDISGLNPVTYNELCIRASFTGTTSFPTLDSWSISTKPNLAPNAPTSLLQATSSDVAVATGGWHNGSVKFSALVSDQDTNDTLQLCVEARSLGTGFTADVLCGSTVAYTGTPLTASVTISLADALQYHWQARVKDSGNAVNFASSYASYGGNAESAADFGVDTTAPGVALVYDGSTLSTDTNFNTGVLDSLSANWAAFDASVSGIARYDYSIGTTAGAVDVRGWTANGTATAVTATSLSLRTSQAYFVNVRAVDNAGNVSVVASSNGQFVAPTLTFTLNTNSINFAPLNSADLFTDVKTVTMTTSTNAYGGYKVMARMTGNASSGSATIPQFTGGTYAAPDSWQPGDLGLGYTVDDALVDGVDRFQSATCPGGNAKTGAGCYAPFSTSGVSDIVADHASGISSSIVGETFTMSVKVQASATSAAGTYSGSLIISNIAMF